MLKPILLTLLSLAVACQAGDGLMAMAQMSHTGEPVKWHVTNSKNACHDEVCTEISFNMDIQSDVPKFTGNCHFNAAPANTETGWQPCTFTSEDKSVTKLEYNVAFGPKLAKSEDPKIGSRTQVRATTDKVTWLGVRSGAFEILKKDYPKFDLYPVTLW